MNNKSILESQLLLVVSAYSPPKNTSESLQVGKYLRHICKRIPTVLVTAKENGGWTPNDSQLTDVLQDLKERITVPAAFPRLFNSLIKRIYPSFFEFPDTTRRFIWQERRVIKQIRQKPTLIYSRSSPWSSALLAYKLAKYYNVPWVMHCSDPFAYNPFSILSKTGLEYYRRWEIDCFTVADRISFTSNKTLTFYQKLYPSLANKFFTSFNVFDFDDINSLEVNPELPLRLVFTGRLYGNRTIKPFIEVLRILKEKHFSTFNSIEVILAGFFDDSNCQTLNDNSDLNIKYLGHLEFKDSILLQHSAHILISIDALSENETSLQFFPSKILDYFAAKRKIIAFTNPKSTIDELLINGIGVCCNYDNLHIAVEFINSAIYLLKLNNTKYFQYSTEQIEYVNKYTAENNSNNLLQVFSEIIDNKLH